MNIEFCFSAVFDSNEQSKHVLTKVGFRAFSDIHEIATELLPVYYKDISGKPDHNYTNILSIYSDIAENAGITIKKSTEGKCL